VTRRLLRVPIYLEPFLLNELANRPCPVSSVRDRHDLSRFLREAKTQEIVITRHGKPAGVLTGFKSEDDWFE